MSYEPERLYRPSNGTEGMAFMAKYCEQCKADSKYQKTEDAEDGCPILLASLIYNVDDELYPKEWLIEGTDLRTAQCTAFERL